MASWLSGDPEARTDADDSCDRMAGASRQHAGTPALRIE